MQQCITFNLFGELFALPILDVREIIRTADVTYVPQAPAFVEGVINLRGKIIPIAALRKRFGIEVQPPTDETRIIVVTLGNGMPMGLLVDSVHEVEHIPSASILPAPAIVNGTIGSEYIQGISNHAGKMIVHLNISKVFNTAEMKALQAA